MNTYKNRREELNNNMREKDLSSVIIDSPYNLAYYTGFTGGEGVYLYPENILITDSRYFEQVEKESPDVTLLKMEKDIVFHITQCFEGKGKLRLGIESDMPVKRYLALSEKLEDCDFVEAGSLIDKARMIKDDNEIKLITRAEQIGDEAFSHILSFIKAGVTEAEIAIELEFFMKKQGASGLSFDTIVASGSNSSMPHASVTDKKIAEGEFVTMDFGCIYKGYCSDMTRTVAVGQVSSEMEKVYNIVLTANRRAKDGIKPGVPCNEIDALARDYIKEEGYGDYFGHGLGHGVGLYIHEEPRFSPRCKELTKPGMLITDEPGIYLPGRFGVRIEDLILVTEDGCKEISNSERSLIHC